MPDIDRVNPQPLLDRQERQLPVTPAYGVPKIGRRPQATPGRGNWFRIFGLFHKLGSEEDDGPVSRIRY